ncbi:glycosyltransferase family 2 protein [Phaeobacter porticola]|uniref:Abequosyltransferase RfbV n=1 Tax=Phaeobacter porticola TaxID=1844006 RepID=A0A1L3I224_9RHOB|nr:glycosyltransferase family A protein [Phaeobacter porticola]APG46138.1 Abequosyltransferase RfbV [Phaeobacter porticola]
MTDIKLSICVPTFNRARYLESLLQSLQQQMGLFPWPVEVIVSDNASDDETPEVIKSMQGHLRLRCLTQSENIGALRNIQKAMRAATGEYAVYLADDDRLVPEALIRAVAQLDAMPSAVTLYAPWNSVDLVTGDEGGPFYCQPKTMCIAKGDYAGLLRHVLDHSVFAEISIVRVSALRHLTPVANDIAFWAFTVPCEYLGFGDVIFSHEPFYLSVGRHFVGEYRARLGHDEVKIGWDKYRGGLEHLFGMALQQGGVENSQNLRLKAENIITNRMLVALRLRMNQGADPIETYALAARVRGQGQAGLLADRMDQIRLAAALQYICVLLPDVLQAEGVAVIGSCPPATMEALAGIASAPLREVRDAEDIRASDIVFNLGDAGDPLHVAAAQTALVALTEGDLMRKFA